MLKVLNFFGGFFIFFNTTFNNFLSFLEIKPRELKPPRKNLRKTIPVKQQSINLNSSMPEEIPEGARLSLPTKQNELSANVGNELTKILSNNNNNNSYQIIELNEKSQTMEEKSKITEENHIDLSNFEEEQKRMEEENRRRKELLAKALADRYCLYFKILSNNFN